MSATSDNYKGKQTAGIYMLQNTERVTLRGINPGTRCPAFQYLGNPNMPGWFLQVQYKKWRYVGTTPDDNSKIDRQFIISGDKPIFGRLVLVEDWVVYNPLTDRLFAYKPEVFKEAFVLIELVAESLGSGFDTTKPKGA